RPRPSSRGRNADRTVPRGGPVGREYVEREAVHRPARRGGNGGERTGSGVTTGRRQGGDGGVRPVAGGVCELPPEVPRPEVGTVGRHLLGRGNRISRRRTKPEHILGQR